jgi:hypothetical protein
MPKSKIQREATKSVGRGYGKNPLKSPKVGGPGKSNVPRKA